ncbi:MAG: transport system permease protein [Lachnospiraceae bacterium]|jgi:iron complex transport system permease protein|nr:transport system permease protein [Lachnospiraceae bacterium]
MKKKWWFLPFYIKLILAVLFLAAMFLVAMVFGAADISIQDVWFALTSRHSNDKILIIRELRLPREVAAIFVGSSLAVSGAIMQGVTKNPLADPGLLGLTSGANAALAMILAFYSSANYMVIMLACFLGASVGAVMVFSVGVNKQVGISSFRIVLAGAAVSTLLQALAEGIAIYFRISKEVSMWTSGGLIGTNWEQMQILIPFLLFGMITAIMLSRQLTILSLNEEVAVGLGQRTVLVKILLLGITALLAGASVALAGNLAFIGLMIPHIVRTLVGKDYRLILPMSILLGAAFMLMADTLGRTLNAPYETPVAAIISMVGLPFFILLAKKRGESIL